MRELYERYCGLDVHKRSVVACAVTAEGKATKVFGTLTSQLEELRDWLKSLGVTHVAMEATGVYWKPVWNVLEGHFELLLVNAAHIKAVPGRKTDMLDAEWIADLLGHGLLRGSFVPERQQRELRELTRTRTALIRERARVVQRLEKVLEGANIKLGTVLTDVMGVSGQRILEALVRGEEDPEVLADLAHWRLQKKRDSLERAVVGKLSENSRFLVRQHLQHWRELDHRIEEFDQQIEGVTRPFEAQLHQIQSIPGVSRRIAEVIVAEVGVDMSRFPSERHLSAWAGMCPANRESAGRRKPAGSRHGSPWLKAALTEAAWAAGRCRSGYLPAQYRRLSKRRGRRRAVVAVGHSILTIVYRLLTDGTLYEDLGSNYFEERDRRAVERRAVSRLEALGYKVTLEPAAPPPQAA